MIITKVNIPENKISIKCPYEMIPEGITFHNTYNDASAMSEVSYMIGNNKECSFHFAIDDYRAVQGLPLTRNSWSDGDGNGFGNRHTINIEICYSKSGGERFDKAEDNAAELISMLMHQYGWGLDKLGTKIINTHQSRNGKYCPHRTLDYGIERFYNKIRNKYNCTTEIKQEENNASIVEPIVKNNVTYQTWEDIKNRWLPNVINLSDYAGRFGSDVCAVYINSSKGNVYYKVHYKGGKWLPEVINRKDYAGIYNKPIDAIMIKSDTNTAKYRVHLRSKNKWLPFVTGYNQNDNNNGYAGIYGNEIDAIQIELV